MNVPADLWSLVLKTLEDAPLSPTTIRTWFEDAEPLELTDENLIVYTPVSFKKNIIEEHYSVIFNTTLKKLFSKDITLKMVTEKPEEQPEPEPVAPPPKEPKNGILSSFTFSTFVEGSCNTFARAAAEAVAHNPARKYNPLVIFGGSGLGKTHLMHAIANEIRRTKPDTKIVYKKGEEFTNEVIAAVRSGDRNAVENLHNLYRQADLLLIDDIHYIAGKEATENEFFQTFDALFESQKQIVVTCDRPPRDIYTLAERIRTRLESGLLADILPPDYETRMAILQRKAEELNLVIETKYLEYIASSITDNVRQLEGVVRKLEGHAHLLDLEIDLPIVTNAIRDILRDVPGIKPTSDIIIEEVASYYGITKDALCGPSRRKEINGPRQIAIYLLRDMTDLSSNEIGAALGRDHSTVLHAVKTVSQKIALGETQKDVIKDIKRNIQNR